MWLLLFSWRGAVIDTEQGTEGGKEGENKVESAVNHEAKATKVSGLCYWWWPIDWFCRDVEEKLSCCVGV